MKNREVVTKDNYKQIVLRRAIILCWVLLAICFVVKIFGGNFFNIVCENERFIIFCNFVDNSFIKYVIYFLYFNFESCALLKIIKPDIKLFSSKFLLFICLSTICWIFKILVELNIILISIDLISIISMSYLLVLLMIFSGNIWKPFLVLGYDIVLMYISNFVKNVGFINYITNSFLITTIFLIDYFILLTLSILYSKLIYNKKKKEI